MNEHDLKQLAQYEQELNLLNTPSQSKSWWLGLPRNAELLSFALQLLREGFDIARAFQARKLTGEGNNYKAILDTLRAMKHEDEEERRWAEELAEGLQQLGRREETPSLAKLEKKLDRENTTGSALDWWLRIPRDKELLWFAEELAVRHATITEAFLAREFVGSGNLMAILAVLDCRRAKPRWGITWRDRDSEF